MAFHPAAPTLWQQATTAIKNAPAGSPTLATSNGSAKGWLVSTLTDLGLDPNAQAFKSNPQSVVDWAWNEYLHGTDPKQIALDIKTTDAYNQAYPAMAELRKQGMAITERDYQNLEASYKEKLQSAGLNTDTYGTKQEYANLMLAGVSADELSSRLAIYNAAVTQAPQAARDYLQQQYGIKTGDLIGYWMNPKTSLPDLQMKAQAAQIGGQAAISGFGNLDPNLALNLAQQGVTGSQAQTGFAKAASQLSLTQNLGDGTGAVGRDTLVGADLGGNGVAAQQLQQEEDRRVARFQSGGSYAGNQNGVSGLGVTNAGF